MRRRLGSSSVSMTEAYHHSSNHEHPRWVNMAHQTAEASVIGYAQLKAIEVTRLRYDDEVYSLVSQGGATCVVVC